jgi:hypothetical protein
MDSSPHSSPSLCARQGTLREGWWRWTKSQNWGERWVKVTGAVLALWALLLLFLYFFRNPPTQIFTGMSEPAETLQLAEWWDPEAEAEAEANANELERTNKTLLVYVYFEKNQLYKDNLQFFLDVGVHERDDIDFVFVVQGRSTVKVPNSFPGYTC